MEIYMDDNKWKKMSSSKRGGRRLALPAMAERSSSLSGLKGRLSRGPAAAAARSSVPGRLASLVKEQRARFYIMRRCVSMLVCWRD